jgi:hypothetical protein
MKNWFLTLVSCAFFITPVFSMNQSHEGEALNAHQKMSKVWKAFESIKLKDFSHIKPHAILYGGGIEMDVFVTFSSGSLKFVSKMEDVPIKSSSYYWSWGSTYAHFCHFDTPLSSIEPQYMTQNISINGLDSSVPIRIETWYSHDPEDVVKIYACGNSAVFRLSLATIEDATFEQDLISYITKPMQEGIYMVSPSKGAKYIDWRVEDDIIDHLVKTKGHKFIKYVTRRYYTRFQTSVAECRAERSYRKE